MMLLLCYCCRQPGVQCVVAFPRLPFGLDLSAFSVVIPTRTVVARVYCVCIIIYIIYYVLIVFLFPLRPRCHRSVLFAFSEYCFPFFPHSLFWVVVPSRKNMWWIVDFGSRLKGYLNYFFLRCLLYTRWTSGSETKLIWIKHVSFVLCASGHLGKWDTHPPWSHCREQVEMHLGNWNLHISWSFQ